MKRPRRVLLGAAVACAAAWVPWSAAQAQRVIKADVVAIDQVHVYNRFGAFNPVGMMYALREDVVVADPGSPSDGQPIGAAGGEPCKAQLRPTKRPRPLVLRGNVGDILEVRFTNLLCATAPHPNDRPNTRIASFAVMGMADPSGDNTDAYTTGISGIDPGQTRTYRFLLEREGSFLAFDNGSPAGGEGDGGSVVLGLFGAVNVQPANSTWYRSQLTAAEFAAMRDPVTGVINYDAVGSDGRPIARILQGDRVVHSDLHAIVALGSPEPDDGVAATTEGSYREFTVVFHDELKTVSAFAEQDDEALHALRDSFGVNYGSQAAGGPVLSNRKGIGPGKDCVECGFEEFTLTSWVSGDPALLVQYPDDPSNVAHSYLNDRVIFRSLHAGPKETHVFHLHAHQWLAQKGGENSTYTDSQSVGPRQSYTYDVTFGGGGNRNKTPGDSVFHCHLYPHFTGGMWGLWRVHDMFEDGTRALPDGEHGAGTDPLTGATAGGTPIPAVVPIPGLAMAPPPRYGDTNGDSIVDGNPGYPFFIAGRAGHRPPQAPLDLAADGGLPRHRVEGGTRTLLGSFASADIRTRLDTLQVKVLEQDGTAVEKAAMAFHAQSGVASVTPSGSPANYVLSGLPPAPGAPFADPCPASAPIRRYDVSAIEVDLVVNAAGWHDPQARINVLDSDVSRFERQRVTADPFFFRANSGECVMFYHTNRTDAHLDRDDFQMASPTDSIGQHIHLVKFDVTASDGSSNGWNYEDGAFARAAVLERINAVNAVGGSATRTDGSPVTLAATGGFQTSTQRWWADPLVNSQGKDRTLLSAFTHDHLAASTIQHHGFYSALLIEPAGSSWREQDGSTLPGQAAGVGWQKMIIGAADPVTHPDHREFALFIADFAIVYDNGGNPVNPPEAPESASAEDPGTFLVNYKNEPLPLRLTRNGGLPLNSGARGELANVFSSSVHRGDPFTPKMLAYEGDRIALRVLQGAHEESHMFTMHGTRWKREIANADSVWVNAQPIGISEKFEMSVARLPAASGRNNTADYLYHFGSTDDMWNGAWGILRTFANPATTDPATRRPASRSIAVLPNNPGGRDAVAAGDIGQDGCPVTAPVREFSVQAHIARDLLPTKSIVYNERLNIADPSGLLLIHAADEAALRSGAKKPHPLVLRANAGDCIRVTLSNRMTGTMPDHPGDAPLPAITPLRVDDFRPSSRVGIHPSLLHYDVRTSDGANVGYNSEQTAAPGASITYTWYAGYIREENNRAVGVPQPFGTIALRAFSDVVKQGSQGLMGAMVIEPQGATHHDPATGAEMANLGPDALIRHPGGEFREHVIVYQDGLNLLQNGNAIPAAPIADDPEDAGMRAANYRTEPFSLRLGVAADADLNDSVFPPNFMLGAIETPIVRANAGQEVRLRVVQSDGRARMHGFSVFGHDFPDDGLPSFQASGAPLIGVGKGITAMPYGGAKRGTWIWRDGPSHHMAGGIWGRMEVQ